MKSLFRKYYQPGLSSLILLPILVLPLINMRYYDKGSRVVGFATPYYKDSLSNNSVILWTYEDTRIKFDTSTVLKDVYLKGESIYSFEEEFAQFAKDVKNQDSLKNLYQKDCFLIHFIFDSTFIYDDLVGFLSLSNKYNRYNYWVDWELERLSLIYNYKYPPNKSEIEIEGWRCGYIPFVPTPPPLNWSEKLQTFASPYLYRLNHTAFIFIGFVGLVGISIWRRKKSK